MDVRSFPNPYQDYTKDASVPFNSAGQLNHDFVNRLNLKIRELLIRMESELEHADPRDFTVYTGWSGIALLYLHLAEVYGDDYLEKAHRVLELHPYVMEGKNREPDELLYGRVGYLYSLLFINKHYKEEKIPFKYIQEMCDRILKSGENFADQKKMKTQSPLLYEWYKECYVGPAHGLAGIYYFLMQPECKVSSEKLQALVRPSVEYVRRLKFPSGNYPACSDDNRDLLVHWCHGAPGVIYMLTQAYKVFQNNEYLADAAQCAEIVWQRGLLKKGYGLCHGAAGNAYSFLAMYNLTHDLKYLYRACKFADWCLDYGSHGCRVPDTTYSLFEGLAGTIYFLSDLTNPEKARFPAFEL
ncbi:glutathione S-transferase LANCL1 isoform 2-T4 [Leptodactylus fuscus]|uniref:glutathione S-transferase LANCL1 isoform X2 n=1 Tax=Leptodactylus fuscus TaxID=238119 RepID=UPI003F4E88E0